MASNVISLHRFRVGQISHAIGDLRIFPHDGFILVQFRLHRQMSPQQCDGLIVALRVMTPVGDLDIRGRLHLLRSGEGRPACLNLRFVPDRDMELEALVFDEAKARLNVRELVLFEEADGEIAVRHAG